nr:MAG TPA: hypothetical protein [Caudoviricetes sp.]
MFVLLEVLFVILRLKMRLKVPRMCLKGQEIYLLVFLN